MPSARYERIYDVVRRIPRGRVATYGMVAMVAGYPRAARFAGLAAHRRADSVRAATDSPAVIPLACRLRRTNFDN